jgi:hypothetical protein
MEPVYLETYRRRLFQEKIARADGILSLSDKLPHHFRKFGRAWLDHFEAHQWHTFLPL